MAVDYFSDLFTSSYDSVFASMVPKVTPIMNNCFAQKVSKQEVKETIFSINGDSVPGPNGMTGLFFQKFWNSVGDAVTKEVQEVFDKGIVPADWNFTHICLILKIPHPVNMMDLIPISLCSVLYKTVSKIMVRRMQPFLSNLISVNQSAFVSERLI